MRIEGANALGAFSKDVTCIPFAVVPGGRGYLKVPGGSERKNSGNHSPILLVVTEKPPSWEHGPLASLPSTSARTEQWGKQGQMRMLYLQLRWEGPLAGAVTPCHTALWKKAAWAQSSLCKPGQNSSYTVQGCKKLAGPQFPHL